MSNDRNSASRMKQIVHHEQCQRCHECCRFRADRQDFAPIFTAGEVETIRQAYEVSPRGASRPFPEFVPFKATDNVFQIRLKKAEVEDPVYPYVCPFLDEQNYACSIYEVRPFDCRIWPFIILKVSDTGQIMLAHFTGNACLALQEVDPQDFDEYERYMEGLVTSEAFLNFLHAHPELIWEHDGQGRYATIPSRDITLLMAEISGD